MTIQTTLIIISISLILMLGLLIWIIRLAISKRITLTNHSFKQPLAKLAWQKQTNNQIIPTPKYKNSRLQAAEKENYLKTIITCLDNEKIYRKPDLTLAELAKKVAIPKHYVSQIINEKMECNFLDFINQYRVEEAKEKLQDIDLQELNILDIGKHVGFNSKSTFYTAFKKYTNQAPGDFRKKMYSG